MKNIDIAGTRAARSFTCISPRRHRLTSFCALATALAVSFGSAWGAPSEAQTSASAVAASGSNADVLALQEGCERDDEQVVATCGAAGLAGKWYGSRARVARTETAAPIRGVKSRPLTRFPSQPLSKHAANRRTPESPLTRCALVASELVLYLQSG